VITPGSKVDVVDEAEGAPTRIEGLLTASTANVAVSAQSVAAAADNTTGRIVDCNVAFLLSTERRVSRPGNREL